MHINIQHFEAILARLPHGKGLFGLMRSGALRQGITETDSVRHVNTGYGDLPLQGWMVNGNSQSQPAASRVRLMQMKDKTSVIQGEYLIEGPWLEGTSYDQTRLQLATSQTVRIHIKDWEQGLGQETVACPSIARWEDMMSVRFCYVYLSTIDMVD